MRECAIERLPEVAQSGSWHLFCMHVTSVVLRMANALDLRARRGSAKLALRTFVAQAQRLCLVVQSFLVVGTKFVSHGPRRQEPAQTAGQAALPGVPALCGFRAWGFSHVGTTSVSSSLVGLAVFLAFEVSDSALRGA